MTTPIYRPPPIRSLWNNLYRNLVLKQCLKLLRKSGSYHSFWTMPHDAICREILLNGYYEKELLFAMAALVKNKTGTVLDVGANMGNHTLFLSSSFRHVISFEPAPRNCWILKANLQLNNANNVTLVAKALGDKNEFMFISEDRHNTNVGLSSAPSGEANAWDRVEVVRGDQELGRIRYPAPIVMIKADVEGFEPRVIRGLESTIRRDLPVIFWEAYTRDGASETMKVLETFGYRSFYHLTFNRFRTRYANKLANIFGRSIYLLSLDECHKLDGLMVASKNAIQ